MLPRTDDLRIREIKELVTPASVMREFLLSETAAKVTYETRQAIHRILAGADDRLLVIIGPCSIHDPIAAMEYAKNLKIEKDRLDSDLLVVMRVYFEKPRTTVGWKGLINDPHLDGSFRINDGLRIGRRLLLELNNLGVPAGVEFLDMISPQYIADLVSWGAIGARTTESQIHRELASGLSCAVGFKNGTDGNLRIAVDAIRTSQQPHHFLSVTKSGHSAIVSTIGNSDCHVILRGGHDGPNYDAGCVRAALDLLRDSQLPARLVVDASHGNSSRDFRQQPIVVHDLAQQIVSGERGIVGAMIESFLVEGRQDLGDPAMLTYGQSITDACIGWDATESALEELARAVRVRRAHRKPSVTY